METIKYTTSDTRVEVSITDWKDVLRELKKVEPALIKSFAANAKAIGRPVEKAVKNAIPSRAPIKGMRPKVVPGRVSWGGADISPWSTEIKVDTRIRKKGKSIVSVWVNSPAVAIADMAKESGQNDGKETRSYKYSKSKTGYRTHTINGQGKAMVNKLPYGSRVKKRDPSRYAWPAALSAMNAVNAKMYQLVNGVSASVNAKMIRISK